MSGALSTRKTEALVMGALFILTLALIGLFSPQEFIRDSLGWATVVDQGDRSMWHPHHLIYMPVNWLILRALAPFCSGCDAVVAGQIHSAFWTLILVFSLYVLARHLTKSVWIAALLSVLLLVSQSIWVLAMQPQSYAASYALMALTFAFLFITRDNEADWRWIASLSLLYAVSVLYHQSMILLGLPLAYYVASTKGRGTLVAAWVVGLAGGFVLLFYLAAAYVVIGSLNIRAFWEYLTLFGQVMSDPNYFNVHNLRLDRAWALMQSVLDAFVTPPWRMRLAVHVVAALLGVSIVGWNILQLMRHGDHFQERLFLVITLIVFSALCWWGSPTDYAWQVFILIPLATLFALAAADLVKLSARPGKAEGIFALLLSFTVFPVAMQNVNASIWPMHKDKGNEHRYAVAIQKAVPPDCVILETKMHVYYNLIHYFGRSTADYWDIITAFYYGNPAIIDQKILRDDMRRSRCIAVDRQYIEPGLTVSGTTGFAKPAEWGDMIAWLFDLQPSGNGKTTWRKFYLAPSPNGHDYVIIQHDQRESAASPDALIHRLADSVYGRDSTAARGYQRWSELHSLQQMKDIHRVGRP